MLVSPSQHTPPQMPLMSGEQQVAVGVEALKS